MKGITRTFNSVKSLNGLSTVNFDIEVEFFYYFVYNSQRQVLAHLGFKSKVLPGKFTHYSAWVGFSTSSPNMVLSLALWGGELLKYFLNAQMSIQGVEYVLTVIFL